MARWQPDARGRLQHAAVSLFLERGYPDVSVADITERAGLTKRTFFNHFPDKREVLFAGAPDLEAGILAHLEQAEDGLDPLDAAVLALARAGQELEVYRDVAHLRRDLIASSAELQERDLMKRAAMTSSLAAALERRGVASRQAALTAQAAVAVFTTAHADWVGEPASSFATHMQRALADLRHAVAGVPRPGDLPPPRADTAAGD